MTSHDERRRVRVRTEEWNEPLGFSQATRVGDLVWVAGQVAVDASGTPVGVDDPAAQADCVWRNLRAALAAAGGGLADLVETTTYLVDRDCREPATAARLRYLRGPDYPTNTLVLVAGLARPEFLIEISGVAVLRARG